MIRRPVHFKNKSTPSPSIEAEARRLLKKYKCPYQLHEVRAQFIGAIASPIESVSPLSELKSFWGGELPPFKNMDEVNELMNAFVMGLWNQLSAHTEREHPFELTVFKGRPTEAMLRNQAQVRSEELEAFLAAFFQGQETIKLPPKLSQSLDVLEDLAGIFVGIVAIPKNTNEPESELLALAENLIKLTDIAETEINNIVLSTASARLGIDHGSGTLH